MRALKTTRSGRLSARNFRLEKQSARTKKSWRRARWGKRSWFREHLQMFRECFLDCESPFSVEKTPIRQASACRVSFVAWFNQRRRAEEAAEKGPQSFCHSER